jgi:peptidoglycan hydrolase CwlO-like protein
VDAGNIVAIVVAFLALIPSVLLYNRERRKTQAETTDILTGAALDLVKQLKTEVTELRAYVASLDAEIGRLKLENAQLRHRVDELTRGAKRLQGQVEAMGQPPSWTVPLEC